MVHNNANNHSNTSKTYGYPGTWYTGKDGKHHKCRTINGKPCIRHSGLNAHITDENGEPIIANTEEELEEKLHANNTNSKHTLGITPGITTEQHANYYSKPNGTNNANIDDSHDEHNENRNDDMSAFRNMTAYVKVNNGNSIANKPVIQAPKPGALMFKNSKMKTGILAKKKKDETRSKLLAASNQPYLTHDEIMKTINANRKTLTDKQLWIYDNPAYKGTTSMSISELTNEIISTGEYGNDLHDSSDAHYENMIDESSYSTWRRMTHADRFSVIDYTEVGYYNANKLLNNSEQLDERSEMLVNGVDNAMRISKPLQHDTVFYRYTGDDALSDEIRNSEETMYYNTVSNDASMSAGGSDDGIVPRRSFISTTMKPGSFLKDYGNHATTEFIMIARRGVRGLSMNDHSKYDEHEFLIDRGYDTRVLGIYETGGVSNDGSWLNHHPILIIEILPSKTAQNGSQAL